MLENTLQYNFQSTTKLTERRKQSVIHWQETNNKTISLTLLIKIKLYNQEEQEPEHLRRSRRRSRVNSQSYEKSSSSWQKWKH